MFIHVFWCQFYWNLFTRLHLSISQHWFRSWAGAERRHAIILSNEDLLYWHICVYEAYELSPLHYNDVIIIMGAIAFQITSFTSVYWIVYSDTDQRKHQSSASLAFVWGIHREPVNSPHKWPVARTMFPFDDVIMNMRNVTLVISSLSFWDHAEKERGFMVRATCGEFWWMTVEIKTLDNTENTWNVIM